MVLRTTGSVFVIFCSVAVVLGQNDWRVTYTQQRVCMLRGSSVDLSCSYRYPSGLTVKQTYWFTKWESDAEDLSVDPEYAGRVEYRGDKKSVSTLRITDLRDRDAAEFKFRFITNQSGGRYSGNPGITLSVTDLQVEVSPSTREGQRVNLTCSSTCTLTGNLSYIWYKNGQRVQQVTSQHHSVTSNSDDSYSCAVEGHKGLCSPAVCVYGQDCIRVTYSNRRICVLRGSSVDISCTYYSYHTVIFSLWFSPGRKDRWRDRSTLEDLAGDPEYAGRVQYPGTGSRSSTLRIRDLRESDSAEYRFMFKTDSSYYNWGDSFPGTTMTVTDLQVEVSPSTREGQWVTLTCSSTCTLTGDPSYIWYKNGKPVPNAKSKTHSVTSKYDDSYSCAVEGHEDLHSPAVCVSGQYCSRVTYSNRRVCVFKGSSVDISCTYYSYHTVIFSLWFSPGRRDRWRDRSTPEDLAGDPEYAGRVQYPGSGSSSSTLRITDLRESDSAEYRFMFKTDYSYYNWGDGFPGTTLTVTGLQVKVTPATVTEGEMVTLTCSSTCTLPGNLSYIWYKNNQTSQTTQDEVLSLDPVSSKDAGSYSCALTGHVTPAATHSPAVHLSVRYKPKNILVSVSPPGEIVEDSSVTLTCSSEANPPVVTYTWYKEKITSSISSGQNYTITNIRPEDSGGYHCETQNEVGATYSTVEMITVTGPDPVAVVSWTPLVVVVVVVVLAAGALLVLLCRTLKRRSTTGSDVTRGAQIPLSPQGVQPDPSSDTYTALNLRNRSTDYDTLASVRDSSSDTYSPLDMRTRSSDYDTLASVSDTSTGLQRDPHSSDYENIQVEK